MLKSFITLEVHENQSAFIPGREARDNIKRLLFLMWGARWRAEPAPFLTMDDKKAFDRVEWVFMLAVL